MTSPSRDPRQQEHLHDGTPAPPPPAFPASVGKNRTGLHRELERLQDDVLVLGSMVDKAIFRQEFSRGAVA